MLKSFKLGFSSTWSGNFQDEQNGRGRGIRVQISNICWIMGKTNKFQKNIYFCFIDFSQTFDCVDHKLCGKFLKRWECQSTSPVSWETCMKIKKQQLEPNMKKLIFFTIGKRVKQGCIMSPFLFNLYVEYIMWNARLDESQAEIKIARRNINNFRCADDTTLTEKSKEELMSLLMKVRGEWKIWLKTKHSKS